MVCHGARRAAAHHQCAAGFDAGGEAIVTADHQNTKTRLNKEKKKKNVSPFKKVASSIYGVQITRNQEFYLLRWVKKKKHVADCGETLQ